MELKHHFIVSLVLSILLFPFFKFNVIYIMVGGFLIDIDHYLWYIFKYRDFNIKKAYKLSKDKSITYRIHVFHLIEILIICVVLSFYSETFLMLLIGLIPHYIMDVYHMKQEGILLNARIHSIVQLSVIKK